MSGREGIYLRAKSITCRIKCTMSNPRILVADDEPALLRLLEFVLGRRGYIIQGVTNGNAAVEMLKTEYLSEVFSWILKGSIEYYKDKKLKPPQTVQDQTDKIFKQQDSITAF